MKIGTLDLLVAFVAGLGVALLLVALLDEMERVEPVQLPDVLDCAEPGEG